MNKLIQNGHNFVDKLVTAKHTIVGEDLARAILKATTDEVALPKRKYVDYLVMCTKDQNVSVSEMSKLILDRTHNSSWVVAFKALLIVHEMMNYGNERFFQYMASDSQSLNLDTFSDRKDTISLLMSKYVRSYANYINAKAVSFRVVGYDFCKVKRGGKEAFFKTLDTKKLFKNLTQLQSQLDSLLAFKPEFADLSNCLVIQAFTVTFKDLVRLVACLNDATANLLENFATLNRKDCQLSLSFYTNFPNYLKKVAKFYKVAEHLNFEPSQMPSLTQVPANLQHQMEEAIKGMDINKASSNFTPLPKPASKQTLQRRLSMPVSSLISPTSPQAPQPQRLFGNTTAPDQNSSVEQLSSSSPFGSNFGDVLASMGHREQEMIRQEEEEMLEMFKKQKSHTDKPLVCRLTDLKASTSEPNHNTSTSSNNTSNNDGGLEDFFAYMDLSRPATSPPSHFSTPTNQPSTLDNISSSFLPALHQGKSILEPTRLNSNVSIPNSPSSPPTPTFLDFSKVSLPPPSYLPPNYMAHPYNHLTPMPLSHISSAPLFPNSMPFNNQHGLVQQQLQQEQQKQFMQNPQRNPFF